MFDFFKKKKEPVSPYFDFLDKIDDLKKMIPEFDPYDMQTLRQTINTEKFIISKYNEFFDSDLSALSAEELKAVKSNYELDQDDLAWDLSVYDLMQQILALAQEGILQSDIKKRLPDANPQHITRICKRFDADGVIKREKKGSSYYITLP